MKKAVVILHGWAANMTGKRYKALASLFEKKGYTVFAPDLPGFGGQPLRKKELEFDDYVQFVKQFIQKKKLGKVILLGHSFGGRIAIRFACLYPDKVSKLILTGASGIPRPLPSLKKKTAFLVTKLLRPIFVIPPFSFFFQFFRKLAYYSIGELDYYKAGSLSETFKNVYKISILSDLPRITVPTLLVWGEEDRVIPLEDARLMRELIPNSKLIIIQGTGHRLPYENPHAFFDGVKDFV